jgi:hypothetical protein
MLEHVPHPSQNPPKRMPVVTARDRERSNSDQPKMRTYGAQTRLKLRLSSSASHGLPQEVSPPHVNAAPPRFAY